MNISKLKNHLKFFHFSLKNIESKTVFNFIFLLLNFKMNMRRRFNPRPSPILRFVYFPPNGGMQVNEVGTPKYTLRRYKNKENTGASEPDSQRDTNMQAVGYAPLNIANQEENSIEFEFDQNPFEDEAIPSFSDIIDNQEIPLIDDNNPEPTFPNPQINLDPTESQTDSAVQLPVLQGPNDNFESDTFAEYDCFNFFL